MKSKKIFYSIPLLFLFLSFTACGTNYNKKIEKSEKKFHEGNFPAASKEIRPLVEKAPKKDKLLALLEAGIIYHTKGNYKTSNQIFENAWNIMETQKKQISKKAKAFFINDRSNNFYGENFERVLVPFYIALNHASLEDNENAFRWLKKMDYELKNMKYNDPKYQQNILARYLYAIMAEHSKKYNTSRVQYNNIKMIQSDLDEFKTDRYILAVKENNRRDMNAFRPTDLNFSFDHQMNPLPYEPDKTGELIIIHESGKAPIKMSRGKLMSDQAFMVTLRISIEVALNTRGAALSTAGVVGMLGTAENPIPIYKKRDGTSSHPIEISLQETYSTKAKMLYDYETTAIRNFNDHYQSYIKKNVASIATKIVVAAIAAHQVANAAEERISNPALAYLARLSTGVAAGGAVAATIKPDLRCWHMLPAKFGVKRFLLREGNYRIKLHSQFASDSMIIAPYPKEILIRPGELKVITVRTFKKVS